MATTCGGPRRALVVARSTYPYVVTGIAIAAAGTWLATPWCAGVQSPAVRLASVESTLAQSPLSPLDNATC